MLYGLRGLKGMNMDCEQRRHGQQNIDLFVLPTLVVIPHCLFWASHGVREMLDMFTEWSGGIYMY